MIDLLLQGLFALIANTMGLFIIIFLAFMIMAGKRADVTPIFSFIGRCLFGALSMVFQLAAIPAEALAQSAHPNQRKTMRQLGQVVITVVFVGSFLAFCGVALAPHN